MAEIILQEVLLAVGVLILVADLGFLILMAWEKYHDKNR